MDGLLTILALTHFSVHGQGEAAFTLYCCTLSPTHNRKKNNPEAHTEPNAPIAVAGSPALDNHNFHDFTDADESVLPMENDLSCFCDSLTLEVIETTVKHWQKEWAPEETWNEVYQELFTHALLKGERETTVFLDECGAHAKVGRAILDDIREIVHTNCPCCRERLKYDMILLYDLLVCVTSEVKFLEVKVDNST